MQQGHCLPGYSDSVGSFRRSNNNVNFERTPHETSARSIGERRKTAWACDVCSRMKLKCDGGRPCLYCGGYAHECTYEMSSRKWGDYCSRQYVELLEYKLQRLRKLLDKFLPSAVLEDILFELPDGNELPDKESTKEGPVRLDGSYMKDAEDTINDQLSWVSRLESVPRLDRDGNEAWDFHGTSSAASFFRWMTDHLRGLLDMDCQDLFPIGSIELGTLSSQATPLGLAPYFEKNTPYVYDLPPKQTARKLCYYSLNHATCLLHFIHVPSFYESLDELYRIPPESFGYKQNNSLALLYSILALGSLYNGPVDTRSEMATLKDGREKGFKCYTRARLLLQDVAECRDITSLQALLFMILYLEASSDFVACCSFLRIAVQSALSMGLHRRLSYTELDPIEDEVRRRVFYTIFQLDTYLAAFLGLPLLLNSDDIDQLLPTEVDDEYITRDGISSPPPGSCSVFEAINSYTELTYILTKIIKRVYSYQACSHPQTSTPSCTVDYIETKEIEKELEDWDKKLPARWRPSKEGPIELIRFLDSPIHMST